MKDQELDSMREELAELVGQHAAAECSAEEMAATVAELSSRLAAALPLDASRDEQVSLGV